MSIALEIAVKIFAKYWYYFALLGLIISLVNSCENNIELRNKNAKSQTEKQMLLSDVSSLTQQVTLEQNNFNQVLEEKDELKWALDSLNKNPKVITDIHYIKLTKELRDTVKIVSSEYDGLMFNRASYEACGLRVDFAWFNMDTIGDFSIKRDSELAIISTNERKRLFDWKWTPRWGKRQFEINVLNKCGDSLITNYKITKQ